MPTNDDLNWALVIATLDRIDILCEAVQLALGQTRPPAEVIIVDASVNLEEARQRVKAVLERFPDVRLEHVAAQEKSLTVQRNQGAALARADILFMIDDDSLMYPDCAEAIMRVYEVDPHQEIAGVQAVLADDLPTGTTVSMTRKEKGDVGNLERRQFVALRKWLRRHLFLMDAQALFIPYDGAYPYRPAPPDVTALSVAPSCLFHGCRMTFRRSVVMKERFESILRSYCPGEDLDASYRMSRHGALLTCHDALLYHYEVAGGRIDRYKVSHLSVLNQSVCLRLHARDAVRARRAFRTLMLRRIFAECLKDGLSRRWTFPQVRGIFSALVRSRRIWSMDLESLYSWYVTEQAELLRS